jgi:lysophospholipase L1-like esterase
MSILHKTISLTVLGNTLTVMDGMTGLPTTDAGVQGEHGATMLHVAIPTDWQDLTVRLKVIASNGAYDESDLPVDNVINMYLRQGVTIPGNLVVSLVGSGSDGVRKTADCKTLRIMTSAIEVELVNRNYPYPIKHLTSSGGVVVEQTSNDTWNVDASGFGGDMAHANYANGSGEANINKVDNAIHADKASDTAPYSQLENRINDKVDKNSSGQVTYGMLAQDVRTQFTGGNTAIVGVDAVGTENLSDGAVAPEKTSFFDISPNLFNIDTIIPLSYVDESTGAILSHTSYYATDFIPVSSGLQYTRTYANAKSYAFYNVSKTFISAGSSSLSTITMPSTAAYIRLTIEPSLLQYYQFVNATSLSSYQPYYKRLLYSAMPFEITHRSLNLFNAATITLLSALDETTGAVISHASYCVSDFIPVIVGMQYIRTYNTPLYWVFYDSAKVLIAITIAANATAPTNAVYMRVTISPDILLNYQIQSGTVLSTYEPYGQIQQIEVNKANIDILTSKLHGRLTGKKANFLGDSITWGYSPVDDGSQLANPFPTLVGTNLGLSTVRNYGVSGSTMSGTTGTSKFVDRYSGMDSDADLIFVLGGTNDWALSYLIGTISDTSSSTFYGALNVLVTGLLNKYPTQTIVLSTPMHRQGDTANLDLINYRNAIINIGAKYGISVLDLYATSGFYPDNATNYTAICPDGRHPNAAGHIKLANRISGFLTTL